MEEQGGSLKVLSSLCCVVLSLHSLLGWGESYVKDPFMSITTVSCISMAWVVSYGKIQRRVARLPTSGVNTSRGAVRIRPSTPRVFPSLPGGRKYNRVNVEDGGKSKGTSG